MIDVYFGLPGCGKTTYLTKLALKGLKRYNYVFANTPVIGTRFLSSDDLMKLGIYTIPENSLLLIDEAGIDFNNRSYKSLPKNLIYFLKMHRHYKIDIIIFSQSYEDMDITFRRLSNQYYYLKRLGPFTLARKIRPILHIDKERKEILEGYEFYGFFWSLFTFQKPYNLCFRPIYYKYFNSWVRKELPSLLGHKM